VRIASTAFLSLALPALAAAQPPAPPSPSPERVAAMARLAAFLEGNWKGSAWMQTGPKREDVTSAETVTREVGGNALLVKGRHTLPDGRVVHDTLGVLSANEDGTYAFHTWLANGRSGVYKGEWNGDAFVWGMQNAGMHIRYTIRRDEKGRWFEIGERSTDGATWTKFLEMTLSRG
jgi:hypothetical protein